MSDPDRSKVSEPLERKIARDGNWESVPTSPDDEIQVLIHAYAGEGDDAATAVGSLGGSVASNYSDVVHATIRADRIDDLASASGVRRIEEHSGPKLHTTSEGVNTTNADQLHSLGLKGKDALVAVIDIRFDENQSEIQDQVIGTTGNYSYNDSGTHGTACAEIVAEMAPEADLVLASMLDGSGNFRSFSNVMDDITSGWDPDAMSMSLGFKPTLRLDGEDSLSKRIDEYTSGSGSNTPEGGLFFVSAGNEASGSHWDGQWQDSGNGYMDFGGTEFFEVTSNSTNQEAVVQSDADWSTSADYVLELYDENKSKIKDVSQSTTPATDVVVQDNNTSYLKIRDEGLDGTEHFDIFAWGNYVSFPVSTSERSLGIPATSNYAQNLSVAAVQHDTDDLESYSSRGPTQDGRRGLDVAAPADTQSDTYNGEFAGTSAACPHAAGAAALLADFSTVDNVDVEEALLTTARSIASDEDDGSLPSSRPNPEVGHGHVELNGGLDELVGLVQKSVRDPAVDAPQFASPGADGSNVYVAGLGSAIEAYPRTGSTLAWSKDRSGDLSDSSPVTANSRVYVGSGGGRMYAFPNNSATPDWTKDVGSAITSAPVVDGSTVYFAANDGTVRAADDSASGSILWTKDVGGSIFSDLAFANDLLFVTTNAGELVCLDTTSSGAVQWRFDTGTELGASSPAVGGGRVFVAADKVYAFDVSTTKSKAWDNSYGGTAGSSPAYSNGTVFVGSADGNVYAFDDGASGSQLWSNATGDAVGADPAAPGDRVIVPSMDGNVYVYLEDGTKIGSTALPDASRSTPVVSDNDVFLLTENGKLVRH